MLIPFFDGNRNIFVSRKSKVLPAGKNTAQNSSDTKHTLPGTGCWINMFEPTIGELVGRCGYDYALIDMEHSPASLDSALPMIRAVQSGGAKAIVRAPDKNRLWIGRLMDMGADGVMVPMVNSAREAEELARAAVYAPEGTRGMAAGIVRATGYGVDTDAYLQSYRQNFLLMVQIETREGVDNVAQIAAVEGIDCLFIGPFDLAGSLGNTGEPEHKETRAGIRRVVKAVRQTGKPLSTLTNPARNARKLFAEGYELVFSGSDVGMIRQAFQADAESAKNVIHGFIGKT